MSTAEKYNRNHEILELVKAGKRYTEIGSRYGISRQAVYAIVNRYGSGNVKSKEPLEPLLDGRSLRGIEAIQFPKIKKYLKEHEISVKMLCEMIGEYSGTAGNVCRFLYGETRKISIDTAYKIMNVVEMDFVEAFDLEE